MPSRVGSGWPHPAELWRASAEEVVVSEGNQEVRVTMLLSLPMEQHAHEIGARMHDLLLPALGDALRVVKVEEEAVVYDTDWYDDQIWEWEAP